MVGMPLLNLGIQEAVGVPRLPRERPEEAGRGRPPSSLSAGVALSLRPGAAPPRTRWVTGGRGTWGPRTACPAPGGDTGGGAKESRGRVKKPGRQGGEEPPTPPAGIPPRPQLST